MYFWLCGIQIFVFILYFLNYKKPAEFLNSCAANSEVQQEQRASSQHHWFLSEILTKSCVRNKNPVHVSYYKEERDKSERDKSKRDKSVYQKAKNYPESVTYFTLSEMVPGLHILSLSSIRYQNIQDFRWIKFILK